MRTCYVPVKVNLPLPTSRHMIPWVSLGGHRIHIGTALINYVLLIVVTCNRKQEMLLKEVTGSLNIPMNGITVYIVTKVSNVTLNNIYVLLI